MRRWTSGLPGATTRLGAMMAHRGLSASQPWMRADTHAGPELRLHIKAEYIDAALTFVSLPTSSCDARPDHTSGTFRKYDERPQPRGERTFTLLYRLECESALK